MPMKRKPKPTNDKVEEFICVPTAEVGNEAIELNPIETTEKGKKKNKAEKKGKKQGEQETMERVVIDEQIKKRSLFADNFKRETYYIHKDLVKAIKKRADKGGKGEKTRIINLALKKYLAEESVTE
jgi:hypothetical protein